MTPFNDNAKILGQAFKNAGHEIRLVGGAVRDFLQGQMPDDLDFCTDATPVEMMVIAVNNDMRLEPTGLQHGTVTFIINHEPFEVTTLRIDTDTDGRHAEVRFITKDFPCLNPQLLQRFKNMGYNLDQDYSFEELLKVFHKIDQ